MQLRIGRSALGVLSLVLLVNTSAPLSAADVDLRDAVKAGQVTVEARGNSDTQSLVLTLSTGLPSIDLAILVGTYFAPDCPGGTGGGGAQPMIVIRTVRLRLVGRVTVTVDANCSDLDAHIPQPKDVFVICETPPKLEALVRCLEAHPEFAMYEQFVIWAFTNDFCEPSIAGISPAIIDSIREALKSCGLPVDDMCMFDRSRFVSVVLSSSGAGTSFFTTELALTNRSGADASLTFDYTAAAGGGSGQGRDVLPAGRQRVLPDSLAYLRSLGIPIPDSGNRSGTLRVSVDGAPVDEIGVTARTTTVAAGGRAGLAYGGLRRTDLLNGTAYLCGLRQNTQDRSNVAVQNAGGPSAGDITLRLTVISGDPGSRSSTPIPDITLSPGGFRQISGILASNGLSLTNGYVRVERVSGTAPFYAYGVINDQFNSDGSFVPPVPAEDLVLPTLLVLPVAVETAAFSTELVATNRGTGTKRVKLSFVADAIGTADHTATVVLPLAAGEQRIIPDFIAFMRQQGGAGLTPSGATFAGAVFAAAEDELDDLEGVVLGARVSTPGGGGRFGLFFSAQTVASQSSATLWLFGLQQNGENRTNLAIVNLGDPETEANVFDIELFDGATGALAGTRSGETLNARGWRQFGAIFATNAPGVTQGYARVTRRSGTRPFLVYGVINDGGAPGQRTGDGAFVWGVP